MVMPKARQMGIAYDHLMDQTAVFNSKGKKLRRSTVQAAMGIDSKIQQSFEGDSEGAEYVPVCKAGLRRI